MRYEKYTYSDRNREDEKRDSIFLFLKTVVLCGGLTYAVIKGMHRHNPELLLTGIISLLLPVFLLAQELFYDDKPLLSLYSDAINRRLYYAPLLTRLAFVLLAACNLVSIGMIVLHFFSKS
ncbi:MAG: hypothetical protein JW982_16720 [Spirochaetes bacterium]|nr:hypothetical protein [Spirochaetota bacterium]